MAGTSSSSPKWGWWIVAGIAAFFWWQSAQEEPDPAPVLTDYSDLDDYSYDDYSYDDYSYDGGDLDCSDYSGPVPVYGSDPHGLDADGDGVGCEANG